MSKKKNAQPRLIATGMPSRGAAIAVDANLTLGFLSALCTTLINQIERGDFRAGHDCTSLTDAYRDACDSLRIDPMTGEAR